MLKALLGFVKPDQGRMTVLELDVAQAAEKRGIVLVPVSAAVQAGKS